MTATASVSDVNQVSSQGQVLTRSGHKTGQVLTRSGAN